MAWMWCSSLPVLVICVTFVTGKADSIQQIKVAQDKSNSVLKVGKSVQSARHRPYFISNRDSYVNAANSFGSNGAGGAATFQNGHGQNSFMMSSYHAPMAPQNSYGVPSQSYGVQGGYDDYDDDQSSKGGGVDLGGLIGLIGLKGLKGTIPLIKLGAFILASWLPLLIPLTAIKLFLILLKPTFTIGRSLKVDMDAAQIAEKLKFLEKIQNNGTGINETTWGEGQDAYNDILEKGVAFGNDVLGKDGDNQCMQRIACEGVFKSLPRIFLRILGDQSYPVSRKRRENSHDEKNGELSITARRKDLATIALSRLKNPQYLTKQPSLTDYKDTEVCKMYTCPNLF